MKRSVPHKFIFKIELEINIPGLNSSNGITIYFGDTVI